MKIFLLALGLPVLLALMGLVWAFNALIKARNQVREGWSGIEVQLKRRHDLVPHLVECVKGYQTHEHQLLQRVTEERGLAIAARGPNQASSAERDLAADLGKVLVLAEAYPDLKADAVFRDLMLKLVEIEDHLQYARRYYNGSVRDLNNQVESFPTNMVARAFGFKVEPFFEVENATERLAPDLAKLSPPTSPSEM